MIFSIGIIILYCALIILACVGLFITSKSSNNKGKNGHLAISILIPFRNENEKLIELINTILLQIKGTNSEIILINDHSENDITSQIIASFSAESNLKLFNLPESESGKKNALTLGHNQAIHEWRIHLDADVSLDENWHATLLNSLSGNQSAFIAMPLLAKGKNNLLSAFEKIETLSLMGFTEAGFRLGLPIMANGANMAITKHAFQSVGGFKNDQISSGDDSFLLQKLMEDKRWKTEFIFKKELIAQVDCNTNFATFFAQRLRWSSKTKHYKAFPMPQSAFIIGLANVIMPIAAIAYFVEQNSIYLWLLAAKIGMDFLLLILTSLKYKQANVIPWFLLLFPWYPIYAIAIVFASFVYKPKWKGRTIKV